MGKEPDDIREQIEETRDRMSETVDAIAHKADVPGRVQEAVADKVNDVKSSIAMKTRAARERAGDIRERVGDALPDPDEVQERTMRAVSSIAENPLGLFFGAVAVGFLVGSLLPATDIENRRLGPVSDQLKGTAQTTGTRLLKEGKAVVRDTIEAAKGAATQSAIEHGQSVVKKAMSGEQD